MVRRTELNEDVTVGTLTDTFVIYATIMYYYHYNLFVMHVFYIYINITVMFYVVPFIIYCLLYIRLQLCFRRFPIDGFSGKWWSK